MHGLRHPLLPRGVPPRQPHPGVERPGLPGRLARRPGAPARHQQLPRVHRPAVPGTVRRRRACSASTPIRWPSSASSTRSPSGAGPRVGWCPSNPPSTTGKSVAVVGSGPAGLACAQQLARAGHGVVVYERAEQPGGLLRYGIPEFKMQKSVLDRRLAQLRAEGVEFRCATSVGEPGGAVDAGAGRGGGAVAARRGRRVCPTSWPAPRGDPRRGRAGGTLPRHLPRAPGRAGRASTGHGLPVSRPTGCARAPWVPPPPRPGKTSSSSVAVTPGPTAWARSIARGRCRCTSSRSCPNLPAGGPRTIRGPPGRSSSVPRRRTRREGSGSTASPQRSSSATVTARCGRFGGSRSTCAWTAAGLCSRPSRAAPSSCRASSCSWPWASSAPSAAVLVGELGLELDARGNVARAISAGRRATPACSCAGTWAGARA